MKPFTSLTVEEQDIKQGVRYNRCECPLALAGKRKFPWARRIEVDHSEMRVHNKHNTTVYHLTGETSRFIYCFDEGASVLPCDLQMQEDYTY